MLAVVDSGVGGLSVWVEIRNLLPHNSLLYYADTIHCPYGSRERGEIERLTIDVVQRVVDVGAQIVVVACNTMTAAAIGTLRSRFKDIDFVGMEPAVKPAAQSSTSGVVGILATRATLRGQLYSNTKELYAGDVQIIEIAGEGLVECVERGEVNGDQCRELVKRYVAVMVNAGVDTLVLGCTHYPFLIDVINSVASDMGGKLDIINPASAVARRVVDLARGRGIDGVDDVARYEFMSSGGERDLTFLKNLASSL